MVRSPVSYADADELVDDLINRVGSHIRLALPLGLGKANHIVNALVDRACQDQGLQLDIITALTLELPRPDNELARRFLEPALSRLFGDYPPLKYARLLRAGKLPANITVREFFLFAGQWVGHDRVQQAYIPANYTHALQYLLDREVNVIAQLLAQDDQRFSLSCNPDISVDLLRLRREHRADFVFAGQVNSELPFMDGAAGFGSGELDYLLAGENTDFPLYGAPKQPVSLEDQAIGIHVASLIRDGGSLQIGIGSIGDAVSQALIVRHENNRTYRQLLSDLTPVSLDDKLDESGINPFVDGLYGVSEMFVDGFLQLADHGILKRSVDGALLHGGFFVESRDFYRRLRDMPAEQRSRFQMKPVSFTNELYGDEPGKRRARVNAAFVNNAMMVTLRGAVVSDGLENGNVVSGVGGQYNFVAQAFALEDARSILTVNATRLSRGKPQSNIVWRYGHQTIPWHLRDIIVTEYGIARLKGRTEAEAIKAMLRITDSRFQDALLQQARSAGKLPADWELESGYRHNTPDRIERVLAGPRSDSLLPRFPFGTDFTEEEQRLLEPLAILKQAGHSKFRLATLYLAGLRHGAPDDLESRCLQRMGLNAPANIREHFYQKLLLAALAGG